MPREGAKASHWIRAKFLRAAPPCQQRAFPVSFTRGFQLSGQILFSLSPFLFTPLLHPVK